MKIDSETTWVCLDCSWGMGKRRTTDQAFAHEQHHCHAVVPMPLELAAEHATTLLHKDAS